MWWQLKGLLHIKKPVVAAERIERRHHWKSCRADSRDGSNTAIPSKQPHWREEGQAVGIELLWDSFISWMEACFP